MIKQILGKGSVYAKKNKYGNRYWYLEVRYLDENDEQHKKYIRGVTRRDAFANGDEFIQQTNEDIERINKNEASDCKNVSFNEFCAYYLEKVCKRTVKDSTYLRYVTTFFEKRCCTMGHSQLHSQSLTFLGVWVLRQRFS